MKLQLQTGSNLGYVNIFNLVSITDKLLLCTSAFAFFVNLCYYLNHCKSLHKKEIIGICMLSLLTVITVELVFSRLNLVLSMSSVLVKP